MELKMMKKPVTTKAPAEQVVKDIRRATRKLHSSEEKIRIVLSGLRGEDSIAELSRRGGWYANDGMGSSVLTGQGA
jgi:transposase